MNQRNPRPSRRTWQADRLSTTPIGIWIQFRTSDGSQTTFGRCSVSRANQRRGRHDD